MNNINKENYEISLEEAKASGVYTFKVCRDLEWVKNNLGKELEKEGGVDIVAFLEFGSIDIELTISEVKNILDAWYYVCAKYDDGTKEGDWESFDFSNNDVVESEHLVNKEVLERIMFDRLIETAKKSDLKWSTLN